MLTDPQEILATLIGIPSVNPMGRQRALTDLQQIAYEYRITDFLQSWFSELGTPVHRFCAMSADGEAPARENLLARIDAEHPVGDPNSYVVLQAHQDTVPVDGMTVEPFSGTRHDGRIYGRGACDVKGGLAAILATAARIANDASPRPHVVLAFTVNEEYGFDGAQALSQFWHTPGNGFVPGPPAAVIVAEPTGFDVVVSHKGVVRWRLGIEGQAAHSSDPSKGVSAITGMSEAVLKLDEYHRRVLARVDPNGPLGPPTLSVNTVAGGISVNTIPDRCVAEIDRRLLPHEHPQEAYQDVIDYLGDKIRGCQVKHARPYMESPGLSREHNHQLAAELITAAAACGAKSQQVAQPYGTDAPYLCAGGIPTVVFGPGSIEQAHTADEWIAADELDQAVDILTSWIYSRGADD